jgi:hypothetical protein
MNVEFSDKYAYDFDHSAVSYEAFVDGARVVCKISDEALQDHFSNSGEPIEVFLESRSNIEAITERIIMRLGKAPESPLMIYSRDIANSK